jgi:hypothetical protein
MGFAAIRLVDRHQLTGVKGPVLDIIDKRRAFEFPAQDVCARRRLDDPTVTCRYWRFPNPYGSPA